MDKGDLSNIWNSQNEKLDQLLHLNKEIVIDLTKNRLDKTIGSMGWPKGLAVLLGVPYTLLLLFIVFVCFQAGAYFMAFGFGMIALIMCYTLGTYFYHLHLINKIKITHEVIKVQQKISVLKISSFNTLRLAVLQLPFWAVCWISLDGIRNSPLFYGGVNLAIVLTLCFISYILYNGLSIDNKESKISQFFLSGIEWDPIIRSEEILNELREY